MATHVRRAGTAFLIVLALAGCAQLPQPAATDVVAPVPFGFDAAALVGPGGDAEGTVHVTADGTLLVCSHGGFHQPSPLWASEGESFRRIDPQPNPIVSGDCDLTSSPDGTWAIVYDTIASATVATSRDRGATWTFSYLSALPIAVDRPWLHWHEDALYLSYANVMAAEPAVQVFARSMDGGRTWTEHNVIHVAQPPGDLQAVMGRMVVADDIRIPLVRGNLQLDGPMGIDHAVSRDGGRTWSLEEVVANYDMGGIVLPAATWAGDILYQVVPLPNGTLHDIALMRLGSQVWSAPQVVATAIDFPQVVGPWIDGRPDGSATLAWVERVETGWTVAALRVHADGRIEGPVQLAPPTAVGQGIGHEFIMVDHLADGRAVVAWPMNTGPECDPEPNAIESRGSQCMYVATERPSAGGN